MQLAILQSVNKTTNRSVANTRNCNL